MCLLVNQSAPVSFDQDFLQGVYDRNPDGVGVMRAHRGRVIVARCVPRDLGEFYDFYDRHINNRICSWHARWATHGDTDMANCHPYQVTPAVFLAHNGVLDCGNPLDKTRSDTWHFVRHILTPMATGVDLTSPESVVMLGEIIGYSNKFVIVTPHRTAVVNEASGVIHDTGAWLSNTYAWPSPQPDWEDIYPVGKGQQWWDDDESFLEPVDTFVSRKNSGGTL